MNTGKSRFATVAVNKSVRGEGWLCLSNSQIILLMGELMYEIQRMFQNAILSVNFINGPARGINWNRILLMALLLASGISGSLAQKPSMDDYRSNAAALNWATAAGWERWNGTSWETAVTWPGQNAGTGLVTIRDRHTVIINVSPSNPISSLLVGEGNSGILQYEGDSARSLSVSGMVTINSGGIFRSALTGTVKNHQLIVQGSMINNGTIDFSTTAGIGGTSANASGAGITFTGASLSETFNCQDAALTNLRNFNGLVLDKGNSTASALTFNPGALGRFKVQSLNNFGFLTIKNGTFKIITSNSFSNPVFCKASPTIPVTGGFELNNVNATVVGQYGTITNNGQVRITEGTFNVGTSYGNDCVTMNAGVFVQSGGTINSTGRFTVNGGYCTITGGKMNLATFGHRDKSKGAFHISESSKLIISGDPLITFAHPNSNAVHFNDIEIVKGEAVKTIIGGTFQIGTSATTTNSTFKVNSDIPFYNLTVYNKNSKVLLTDHLTVNNQLVMKGGNIVAPNDTVTITNPDSVAIIQNSGFITGTLERAIDGNGSPIYRFPIGNRSNYTPLELTFSNISNGGYISVISVGSDNPNLASSGLNSAKSVNSYWRISNNGVSFFKLDGKIAFPSNLLDPDVNISNLRFGVYNNTNWSYLSTSLFTGNSYTFSDLSALVNSSFVLAECIIPTIHVGTTARAVCVGKTIALLPAIGGTWTSSNTLIATVIAGIATGISEGKVTFTFTQTGTLCNSTTPSVTVNPLPHTSLIYHN